jgi:hypothetical protein
MKLSMTGQEKGDLLIQVTAWAVTGRGIIKIKENLIKICVAEY